MTDISIEGVAKFWSEYQDPMIYRVITFLEGVERWTLDGNQEVEAKLSELGEALDKIDSVDMEKLGNQESFIHLANYVKSGRALRLLQAIDTAHPGAASKLLMHAEETSSHQDDQPGLFLRRNIVFERLRLLSRVFSPERFALVVRALEGDEPE